MSFYEHIYDKILFEKSEKQIYEFTYNIQVEKRFKIKYETYKKVKQY